MYVFSLVFCRVSVVVFIFVFFKQKTAYEMRISDWSSDVCSSDLQVLLDVNAMAAGKDYFNVGEYEVSQDNRLLAWAEDDVGRRQYTIRFRNLDTGEAYPDVITGVSPNLVWADDNRTVF